LIRINPSTTWDAIVPVLPNSTVVTTSSWKIEIRLQTLVGSSQPLDRG